MPRPRRTRDDLRERLLDSALHEFAAKGFDGASTRSIARRVDAHQPQINYHFSSKEALWDAAVDHLFGLLTAAFVGLPALDHEDPGTLGQTFAELIHRFVRFAAAHPELNRIMVHEATEDSDRLHRMIERHVRPWFDATTAAWNRLRDAGIAAPIETARVYWIIVGAASLPFVNAPEVRILAGTEPSRPRWVEQHADDVTAMLLPGLAPQPRRRSSPSTTAGPSSPESSSGGRRRSHGGVACVP